MPARFLCTADVHIGRESSGFDDQTALGAWERIVALALETGVDAVLIAGDFFENPASQFATREAVSRTLKSLIQNEIRVVAVSGNHDYAALPTFCKAYPDLIEFLSSDHWDQATVKGVRILGRSFGRSEERDLVGSLSLPPSDQPTIGLMHADVDSVDLRYNAVPLAKLRVPGVAAWVLGHSHVPKVWDNPAAVYPGSPQPLDFGERGVHGVRILELDGNEVTFSELKPVSSVRYEFERDIVVGDDETVDIAVERRLGHIRSGQEKICLRAFIRYRGDLPDIGEGLVSLGEDRYEVVGADRYVELDLHKEAEQGDARGQAARLLLGLSGFGEVSWRTRAQRAVEDLRQRMVLERKKLVTDGSEEFNVIREALPDEAVIALRRSLNRILSSKSGDVQ